MKMKTNRKAAALLLALLLTVPLSVPALAAERTEPLPIQNTDGVKLDEVYMELEYIPEPLLCQFEEYGWVLHMDQSYLEQLSQEYGYRCVAATSYKNKGIYLTAASSLVHEFGHFLHYTLDFNKETKALFEDEAESAGFLRYYARRNFREYFADCFAYWVKHREDSAGLALMQEQAPETYRYFEELERGGWVCSA